jgi:hypothetical protein
MSGYAKTLFASYQTYRQLSGCNLPLLESRAFVTHTEFFELILLLKKKCTRSKLKLGKSHLKKSYR